MKFLKPILLSGKELLPLVEGGKGISISNGISSGAWAASGGVGTFSGVNADSFHENSLIPQIYYGKTRRERHKELIAYSILGGINQAQIAYERSNGQGRLHMNILWEMGGAEHILQHVLEGARGLIHGVTCVEQVCRIVLLRSLQRLMCSIIRLCPRCEPFVLCGSDHTTKFRSCLGGVVYEDPWLAGGHNGLSNSEDPLKPEPAYPRVFALRQLMNQWKLHTTPIIIAGGVWYLREWEDWVDNPELGPIAFQFGTRPLVTQESPISRAWKEKLLSSDIGKVILNRYSPTGFYSSAVSNNFFKELEERNQRQVPFTKQTLDDHIHPFFIRSPTAGNRRGKPLYLTNKGFEQVQKYIQQGFTSVVKTPDNTLLFVTPEKAQQILADQIGCMGCLSACLFSNWAQNSDGTTGRKPDPRSYCIQKTLQAISHSNDCDNQLMFSGHNAYRFATDPFYSNGFIPTVKQLVERIVTGD